MDTTMHVKSEPRKARLAAGMTYEQMTKYSGLEDRVIRNYEAVTDGKFDKTIAKMHQEGIDKYLLERQGRKSIKNAADNKQREIVLKMIKSNLDSLSLDKLLNVAETLRIKIDKNKFK